MTLGNYLANIFEKGAEPNFVYLVRINFAIAFIPHVLAAPFWLNSLTGSFATIMAFIYCALILPLLIVPVNFDKYRKYGIKPTALNVLIILFALLLSNFSHYALWGLSSGRFLSPGDGTVKFMKAELTTGLSITVVLIAIFFIRNTLQKRKH